MQENQTQVFLGKEKRWSLTSIELNDVQALWGGERILLKGSGRAVVQAVSQGLQEQRYETILEQPIYDHILEVCIEQDFITIRPAERPGIPDEARPTITVVNGNGARIVISKWAGVKDERFKRVYLAIKEAASTIRNLPPVYRGPYIREYDI